MDFKNNYEITVYEVLSEDLKKYTSTSVSGSGGGGYVSATGGHVSDVKISSETYYHSDQIIWLKNLQSGAESRVEFKSFNIEARVGHRLLFARDNSRGGLLERVVNIDTGKRFNAYGCYHDESVSFWYRFFASFGYALLFSIPLLSIVPAIIGFFVNFIGGRGFWLRNAYIPRARTYGLVLTIVSVGFFALTIKLLLGSKSSEAIVVSIFSMPFYLIYIFIIINRDLAYVTKQGKLLDDYLANYIKSINLGRASGT
jgi:hypothetical protein